MMGECWHEYYPNKLLIEPTKCLKCGASTVNPSLANKKYYDTWPGFGKLWVWAQEQEWWVDFEYEILYDCCSSIDNKINWFIHPERFACALYGFLKKYNKEPVK